jgi:hypothetical protein
MVDIASLSACGWFLMYNPTENLKLPITEWEQSLRSILRQSAKPLLLRDGLKQKRSTASLNLSGIGVCPPMLFIRPESKNVLLLQNAFTELAVPPLSFQA